MHGACLVAQQGPRTCLLVVATQRSCKNDQISIRSDITFFRFRLPLPFVEDVNGFVGLNVILPDVVDASFEPAAVVEGFAVVPVVFVGVGL